MKIMKNISICADSFDMVLWLLCNENTMRLPANDNWQQGE